MMADDKPADWRATYGPWLMRLAVALAATALGYVGNWLGVPPPRIEFVEVEKPVLVAAAGDVMGQGWVSDPDEVANVVADLPHKAFGDTPAGRIQELPKQVFGWQRVEKLLARPPPIKNQGSVGSCVSFGTNTAVERTLAGEIVRRGGGHAEWTRFAEEVTYAGSRVEIGGGRIRGDGSVGAWAAKFVTQWGMVPRKAYGGTDLSEYSEQRCRDWGRAGVPDEFEGIARKYPIKSTTQVKAWEELKAAVAQDYYVAICSNQGFASRRDANGVARASGSWAHCMACDGYYIDQTTGKEYGHIVNSWGTEWISGPVGWGNPPADGFWAESATVDRMLKQGDSWAFSGVTGFPRRSIDWLIHAEPRQRDRLAIRPEAVLSW